MRIPVKDCPAGPAMDAAVAKVLGQVVKLSQGAAFQRVPIQYVGDITSIDNRRKYEWVVIPPRSKDIAAAWELWDNLSQQKPFSWALYSEGENVTVEYYGDDYMGELEAGCGDWEVDGKAPLAICRAFLKANGVEFVEVPEG